MTGSLTVMIVAGAAPIAIAGAFMLVGAIYIASRPSRPMSSSLPPDSR